MAAVRGAILVDVDMCKGCEICRVSCPQGVIAMSDAVNGKGYHYARMESPEACTGCSNCGIVCPDGAIAVYRVREE